MAATFVNLESSSTVRIVSTESSRELAHTYAPDIDDFRREQIDAYIDMNDDALFTVTPVRVDVPVHDIPGPSRFKIRCTACRAMVRDKKEVLMGDRILCRPCAYGTDYRPLEAGAHMKTA